MLQLKQLFDGYIKSSIHVTLSVFALVKITGLQFQISVIDDCAFFSFFGSVAGYNFVKYYASFRNQKGQVSQQLKGIAFLSVLSLLVSAFYFLKLERITQIVAVALFFLTVSYSMPFIPNRKNIRNWPGMKIYIVALCWVGVTVVLPVINSEIPITSDFYLKCIQRFVLVLVLTLIFEIMDLKKDSPNLKTVPQQIGVKRTKMIGYGLLMIFCLLEFFNSNVQFLPSQMLLIFAIAIVIAIFLFFDNEKRSIYYTSFWVEGIPILWWFLFLLMGIV